MGRTIAKSAPVVVALMLILSLSLLAIPVKAHGPDGYNWTEYSGNPIFTGTSRAYYPRVIKVGTTYHMWYTDYGTGVYEVRHTTSADGKTWVAPATIVSGLTGRPSHTVVLNVGTDASPHYRMWYGDEGAWPYNVSCFRAAESADGVNWTNDQAIGQDASHVLFTGDYHTESGWRYGSYGPGAVLYNPNGYSSVNVNSPMGNKYVMYYDQLTDSGQTGVQEVTELAVSEDGTTW